MTSGAAGMALLNYNTRSAGPRTAEPPVDAAPRWIDRAFEHLPFGLLLLAADLTVRYQFGRRLSPDLPVRVRFGRLVLPRQFQRQVESLIRGKGAAGPSLVAVSGPDAAPVALVFERISGDGAAALWRVGVFADVDLVPSIEALRLAYGMTPSEAVVVRQLVAGRSLRTTAQRLGISHETARVHLKSVFLKANARCQAALVARVLSGPALLLGRDRLAPAASTWL